MLPRASARHMWDAARRDEAFVMYSTSLLLRLCSVSTEPLKIGSVVSPAGSAMFMRSRMSSHLSLISLAPSSESTGRAHAALRAHALARCAGATGAVRSRV